MQKQKSNETALHLYNLYIGGLIALILVVLQAVLGLDKADIWITISVVSFALALPPLGGMLVVNLAEERYPYAQPRSTSARLSILLFVIGVIATFIGMVTAFWHISWLAAVIFLAMILVVSIVYGWYVFGLEKKPDPPAKN
jgi:hypothetical protein